MKGEGGGGRFSHGPVGDAWIRSDPEHRNIRRAHQQVLQQNENVYRYSFIYLSFYCMAAVRPHPLMASRPWLPHVAMHALEVM